MKYFTACKTQEEAKRLYRQLALEHHPDKGGDTAVMQEINTQYANYLKGSGYDFANFSKDFYGDDYKDFSDFISKNPKFAMAVILGIVIDNFLK